MTESRADSTTIRITKEAHKILVDLSTNKQDTFSSIILNLADYYRKERPKR